MCPLVTAGFFQPPLPFFQSVDLTLFFLGGGGGDGGIEIQTLLKRMKFWLFSGDISRISVLGIHSIQAENSLLLLCQLCCANSHESYLYTPPALSPS